MGVASAGRGTKTNGAALDKQRLMQCNSMQNGRQPVLHCHGAAPFLRWQAYALWQGPPVQSRLVAH